MLNVMSLIKQAKSDKCEKVET